MPPHDRRQTASLRSISYCVSQSPLASLLTHPQQIEIQITKCQTTYTVIDISIQIRYSLQHKSLSSNVNMVLKLYGSPLSPFVRLVAAVLLEKKVPFELVSVDLSKGEHKTPDYLSKHPFGQVPYIVCDLLILSGNSYDDKSLELG